MNSITPLCFQIRRFKIVRAPFHISYNELKQIRPYLHVKWKVIEINKTTSNWIIDRELTKKCFKCGNIIPLFTTNINNTAKYNKKFAISRFDENKAFFPFIIFR